MRGGHLYGSLIDIISFGAPLMLVALGMTLVIATGGIDLSVGAVVAISAALACLLISHQHDQNSLGGVLVAIAAALGLSMLLGLWNGILVAVIGIQPIVATLILMVAGRGIAQLITQGPDHHDQQHAVRADRSRLPAHAPLLHLHRRGGLHRRRRSSAGALRSACSSSRSAATARRAGSPGSGRGVSIIIAYVFSGLCAGIAGLMISSNLASADGNNAGLWIELDAILAVVIGGTALAGGRFFIAGTLVGAVLIQTLVTTIYSIGIPPGTILLFKALVVTAVCLIQSPAFRERVFHRRHRRRPFPGAAVAADEPHVEVPA